MKVWTYKKTNKKYEGLTVYKKYMFDEFVGYCYKQRLKQLRMYRDKQGKAYYEEVNVGWEYPNFVRYYKDENGNIVWSSWEELEKEFA